MSMKFSKMANQINSEWYSNRGKVMGVPGIKSFQSLFVQYREVTKELDTWWACQNMNTGSWRVQSLSTACIFVFRIIFLFLEKRTNFYKLKTKCISQIFLKLILFLKILVASVKIWRFRWIKLNFMQQLLKKLNEYSSLHDYIFSYLYA